MNLEKIKWEGLVPSFNVFSGELAGLRITLTSKGSFYELKVSNPSSSRKIEKPYLDMDEKKQIIRDEFSKYLSVDTE